MARRRCLTTVPFESARPHTRSPLRCTSLGLLAAGIASALACAGPTFEEVPDAGSTPGGAQPVGGPSGAPVTRIRGTLAEVADEADFEDVFVICITDPELFSATVNPVGTTFDTQLWLFDLQGFGLLSNDNNPLTFPTIFSRVEQPATDATGQNIPGPGLYLLAISSKQNHPASPLGPIFNDQSANGTEVSGPDGPGAPLPLFAWTQAPGTVGGQYTIDLTGVKFLDLPCTVTCPEGAAADDDAGACSADGKDPNGGCPLFGAPMQDIGLLDPTGYVAVCGTTGTIPPNHRDIDWFRFHLDAPAYVTASLVMTLPDSTPVPNAFLQLTHGADCATLVPVFTSAGGPCPTNSGPIALPPGAHTVVVSVDGLAPGGPPCPVEYLLWLGATASPNALCGAPFAGSCGLPHPLPGCSDLACCDLVCAADFFCCDASWDLLCADHALAMCLHPAYSCLPKSVPNDCAANAMPLPANASVDFDTSLATTDGPPDDAGACSGGNDIWFRIQAPADGKLLLSLCGAADFDTTLAAYRLSTDGDADGQIDPTLVFDGVHLIGCDDDGCGAVGGASILDVPVHAGQEVLVRVGGFVSRGIPASGVGTLSVSFASVVFTTGPTFPVLFDGSNGGALATANVSFASGHLGPLQPQRWLAQAFTVPPGPLGGGFTVTEIHGYGFSPAEAVNESLDYIIWNRTGTARPEDGDQVATGSVPFPVPFDLPAGSPIDEDHRVLLSPGLDLGPGDYWLTLYASNTQPRGVPANFRWFIAAPDGINVLDENSREPFAWRSATFPVPGFVAFTLPPTTLQQVSPADPKDLYNAGFTVCGVPIGAPCPADLNGNGSVGGGDLAILLGAWGNAGPGDLNGDGIVNGADLAMMLGSWGPC